MTQLKAIWKALRLGLADALLLTLFGLGACVFIFSLIFGQPPGGWFTTIDELLNTLVTVFWIVCLVWIPCFVAEYERRNG